jgi:hypothetical protein
MTHTNRAIRYSINEVFISAALALAAKLMSDDPCLSYHDALQQAKQTVGKELPCQPSPVL